MRTHRQLGLAADQRPAQRPAVRAVPWSWLSSHRRCRDGRTAAAAERRPRSPEWWRPLARRAASVRVLGRADVGPRRASTYRDPDPDPRDIGWLAAANRARAPVSVKTSARYDHEVERCAGRDATDQLGVVRTRLRSAALRVPTGPVAHRAGECRRRRPPDLGPVVIELL